MDAENITIWGVDPGIKGALSVINFPEKKILRIERFESIPVPGNKIEKNRIDALALKKLLNELPKPDKIILEYPNIIAGNMKIAQVLFFKTLGNIEACLAGYGEIVRVNPTEWKKSFNLIKKGKGESTKTAKQLFNDKRITNADIAESALLAYWGYYYLT
ncbi:MAG: hypothetical protein R3240_00705 [Gammaproteobacteria bacterium]|nr:hypothetical protein [Gammaproteobacteria bacterium]